MTCKHYELRDKGNADWCKRYVFHVDRDGRFCTRCNEDASFRAMLGQLAAVRIGTDCDAVPVTQQCAVFGVMTDEAQCKRCKKDALFRAFLRGQGMAISQEQEKGDCPHRGETIRTEMRACCGGESREIEIFVCAQKGEAHRGLCTVCDIRRAEVQRSSTDTQSV